MDFFVRTAAVDRARPGPSPQASPTPTPSLEPEGPEFDDNGELIVRYIAAGRILGQYDAMDRLIPLHNEDGDLLAHYDFRRHDCPIRFQ
ncbi:hypothetical protein PG996_012167 [Apiospora saccharicola]|uniref:Uncharacterized protein n=1 Tax=Apiospora saccharicola TaxID=335842 RepID=A0ABR1U3W0_9PEZI